MILTNIITFDGLLEGLKEEDRTPEIKAELRRWYDREMSIMKSYADKAKKPFMALYPFRKSGSQYIADFLVNDTSIPVADRYNWHGQNTSQWRYAGCICFDERDKRVSTHH